MFFLDITTKGMATRQQWYCRPEHHCTILFSFQSVHIYIYAYVEEQRGAVTASKSF